MLVRTFLVMPTRPCRFCFALQDDSVFADFNVDEKGRLFLVRISFDGYGCCYPSWSNRAVKMPIDDSQKLVWLIEAGELTQPVVSSLLRSYFVACGESIWVDALQEHRLV